MNRIKHLKEQRGAKLKELEALNQSAETRAFDSKEGEKFDALETEIKALNVEIERAERSQNLLSAQGVEQSRNEFVGMKSADVEKYSLLRALRMKAEGQALDGIEAEMSQEEARRLGRNPAGFFVPMDVMARSAMGNQIERRTNTVNAAGDGGFTVGSTIDYANMVDLLRNQSHVMAMGARVITGLVGDVTIPRVLTGATAYWVSETGTIAQGSATFGQIAMKPRRIGSSVPYSKQFLAQSGLGVESFIRDDIMAAFGTELDRVAINGAGAVEPLGILNLATADRATSVTFGAAPTWAKVVSFETNVEAANALNLPGSNYAYLTTPGVKQAWKTTLKSSGVAGYLWEGNEVNGYGVRSTNQVPSNKVVYGQMGQVIYGEWSGIDVTVDPYTGARAGLVNVTMQKFVDMVIRQGKAFAVSTDAGNQ